MRRLRKQGRLLRATCGVMVGLAISNNEAIHARVKLHMEDREAACSSPAGASKSLDK